MQKSILFAGFGGQGILFAGKVCAYAGMLDGKKVTWLPSYGPEMRGGTANCSVCVSDEEIGCPMVFEPNLLFVLNLPSYEAFINKTEAGGTVLINSSLIDKFPDRKDIHAFSIPATKLASDNGIPGLANIIMLGAAVGLGKVQSMETTQKALESCISQSKRHLLKPNFKALEIGRDFAQNF